MSSTPSAPPRCTLLVVDDEPTILEALSLLLGDQYDILTAPNADRAEAVVASQPVALILADQRMPGRTGVQLLEWVRQHSPKTIRLMMTGYTDFDQTVHAINRGEIYRIILKPWRAEELRLILGNAARAYALERSHETLLADLQTLNGVLEERVQQRTRELQEAVHQLGQRNQMLEKLSLTDPLTGLPNRRAMDRVTEAEVRRRARHPSALALGIIDVDNFKEINTAHLLPGGDQALIGLSQVLASCLRVEDTVGRIGGDEFLAVAPQTTVDGAHVLAERVRTRVAQAAIPYKDGPIRLTVSIGFAVVGPELPASFDRLHDAAAAALSQAKERGRNRCVVSAVT